MPAEATTTSYARFLGKSLGVATDGNWLFYGWMTLLTAISLVGAHAWAIQVRDGMIVTNMSDHVSWGLYIANFTFCVGLAAGGVMMVIPAYLYDDDEMHGLVIIGEAVAIAAILMSTLSVVVDLGRPDRFWHLIPGIGRFNWPLSMLWAISIRLACIVGIWIEKGMGLVIPGFIPSTLHEIVEYAPSMTEWKVTAGIWAFGMLTLTLLIKLIAAVELGHIRLPRTVR